MSDLSYTFSQDVVFKQQPNLSLTHSIESFVIS